MPVLTITVVTAASDKLTIPAHGLNTGDAFLRIYTPNGTIPGGLAPVTDYWAIRADANTIQLATSSANAMAGVQIDITSAGSGTLELLQGLPYAVPRIAANGTSVLPQDDNAAWQALVATWNLLTGQAQTVWTGAITLANALVANAGITVGANSNVVVSGTGRFKHGTLTLKISPASCAPLSPTNGYSVSGIYYRQDTGGMAADCPINLPFGARISAVRAIVKDNATGPDRVTMQVYRDNDDGTATSIGSLHTTSGAAGTAQTLAETGLALVYAAANSWFVRFGHAGTAQVTYVLSVEVDYDQP